MNSISVLFASRQLSRILLGLSALLTLACGAYGTVNNPTLSAASGSAVYGTGGSVAYTVTVSQGSGQAASLVDLSLTSTLPTGVTASFNPSQVDISSSTKTSTLTFTVSATAAAQTVNFTVQAVNHTKSSDKGTVSGSFVISPASTTLTASSLGSPSVFGTSVTFTANVTKAGSGVFPTGSVTFKDGATTLGSSPLNASGQATLSTASLGAGAHTITVSYGGDTNYTAPANATVAQTVNPANQTINFPAIPTHTYGDAPFSVSATATSGLTVTFTSTNTAVVTVLGSTVTIVSSGNAGVKASQSGNANFNAAPDVTNNFVVNQAATALTAGSSANPSTYGQSVTLTASVTKINAGAAFPVGSVSFTEGSTNIGTAPIDSSTGQASISTSGLTAATHTIKVHYGGDTNYSAPQDVTISQTVNRANTTAAVVSSNTDATIGTAVTFTATVTNTSGSLTPDGVVTFQDGGASIGTGTLSGSGNSATATFSTSSLTAGTHSITVAYSGGTGNFALSNSAAISQQVRYAPTIALTSAPNPSGLGQSVTLTATLSNASPAPSGSVSFSDGGAIGSGAISGTTATMNTSTLPAGANNLTASYAGDSNNKPAVSGVATQTVDASTTTALASNSNPSTYKGSVTFTATVTATTGGAPATGTVTFKDGATTLSSSAVNAGGVATFTTSSLTGGAHTITASFVGSGGYLNSSAQLTQNVNKASQTITFGALGAKNYGDPSFALTASSDSGLQVSFSVTSGPATISGNTLTITGAGNVTVKASQAGDGNYLAATDVSQSFAVAQANLTVVGNPATRPYAQPNPAFSGTLTGTVNGDTITATYSTAATPTSPVGSYPIDIVLQDPGNKLANYNLTLTKANLTVTKASQTITFPALAGIKFGGSAPLGASSTSGLDITYTVVTTNAGSVTGSTYTPPATGAASTSVQIKASQPGDTNYNAAADVTQTISVKENTPPSTSVSFSKQPNAFGWNNSAVKVTLTSTDNAGGDGVLNLQYSVDGGATQTLGTGTDTISFNGQSVKHTITYFGTDVDGNVEATQTQNVWIDGVAPIVTNGTPARAPDHTDSLGHGWYTSPVDVTFSATDNLSGINGDASVIKNTLSGYESNNAFLSATFTDFAGNSASGTFTYRYDDKPPVLAISGVQDGDFVQATGAIHVAETETFPNGAPVVTLTRKASLTDAPTNVAYTDNMVLNTDGIYTLTVTASDLAGNTATQQMTFTVLSTAPTVSFISPDPAKSVFNSNQTVTWQALDAVGEAVTNFVLQQLGIMTPIADTTLVSPQFFNGYGTTDEGSHTVTVTAQDKANNQAQASRTFLVDKTPPTLSPDSVPTGGAGQNGWFTGPAGVSVNLHGLDPDIRAANGNLAVVHGSGVQSVVYSTTGALLTGATTVPGDAASFQITTEGVTTVNYVITDNAGNSVADSITVKYDNTAPVLANVPGDITLDATGTDGAVATFGGATATDNLTDASSINIAYSTPSGATFPIGVTTVMVTATDEAGNHSTASFKVTVHRPVPTLASVAPASATFGDGTVSVTLTGTGFMPDSVAKADGVALATTFVSWTEVTAQLPTGNAGTKKITVTTPASDVNAGDGGDTGSKDFVVAKADQTITFAALIDKTYGDSDFTLGASSSSGLDVSFAVKSGHATLSGNTVHLTGAGPVTITAKQAGSDNYNAATDADQTFNVAKAKPVVTIDAPAEVTYNGQPHPATATVTGVNGDHLDATITYSPGGSSAPVDAGNYDVDASFAGDDNYLPASAAQAHTKIDQAHATLSFGNLSFTFDGNAKSATVTTDPADLDGVAVTYNGNPAPPVGAGDYAVHATLTNKNYEATALDGNLHIEKAVATISLSGLTGTFDGHPHTVSATTTPAGLTVNITYGGSSTAPTNAGSYQIVATIDDANYQGSNSDSTLSVAKADPTVTVTPVSTTFDGLPHSTTATVKGVNGESLGSADVTYSSTTPPVHAGHYTADAHYAGDGLNYNAADGSASIDIAKADPTVAVTGQGTFDYDGMDHPAGATVTGVQNSPVTDKQVAITYNGGNPVPHHAGAYQIVATFPGDDDYNGASANGSITINAISPTISITGGPFTYDGQPHGATVTVTGVPGDSLSATSVTYDGVANVPKDAKQTPYNVAVSFAGGGDYKAATQQGTLEIDQRKINVTAADATKVYGDPVPPLSGSADDLVAGDTLDSIGVSFTSTGTQSSNVGDYAINGSGTPTNYSITFHPGNLHISPAPLSVVVDSATRVYGQDNPAFTGTLTGVVNNDGITASYSSATDAHSPVGNYPITATLNDPGNRLGNYTVTNTSGNLAITQATPIVKVDTFTVTFDGNPHAGTGTATGVFGEDLGALSFTYGGDGSVPVHAGTYSVTGSFAGNDNYVGGSAAGTITISKADQTIAFAPLAGKTYGDADFTVSATGGNSGNAVTFTVTGNATISGNTVHLTGAGSAVVTAHQAGNADYNDATDVSQTFTIAKGAQTITWSNPADIVYGTTLSATQLNATVAGSGSNAAGALTYTPPSGTLLDAGAGQTLSVSAAETADYLPATKTVTINVQKADQTITFTPPGKTYGDAPFDLTPSVSGGKSTGALTFTVVSGPGTISGTMLTITGAGTILVKAVQAGDKNYNDSNAVTAPVTVAQKALTVTADNRSVFLNSAGSTSTTTVTGLVPGDSITFTASYQTADTAQVGTFNVIVPNLTPVSDPGNKIRNYSLTPKNGNLTVGYKNNTGILAPLNADGTSTVKQGSTVPLKFQVFDANGKSVGPTTAQPNVVLSFLLVGVNTADNTPVNETPDSTTPDTVFRWDPTAQQWIFNLSTKNLKPGSRYFYQIKLLDGTFVTCTAYGSPALYVTFQTK